MELISSRQVILPISALVRMPINPKVRTDKITDLVKDIKETRRIVPIYVVQAGNGKYVIMDGHRRLAAAKELGLKDVPCSLDEGDSADKYEIFKRFNRNMPLDGKQKTELAYTANMFWTNEQKAIYDYHLNLGGIELWKFYVEKYASVYGSHRNWQSILLYLGVINDKTKCVSILMYIVEYRQTTPLRILMKQNVNPKDILRYIKSGLKMKQAFPEYFHKEGKRL